MKLLLDMNFSPAWAKPLSDAGFTVSHWYEIGEPDAPDVDIFNYARENDFTIITHDIDFTHLLALTGAESPSVVLIRAKNIRVQVFSEKLISALHAHAEIIDEGAIVVIDEEKMRVRILPLKK